jgi:hypothetical protein
VKQRLKSRYRLSPVIEKEFDGQLELALDNVDQFQNASRSVGSLVRLLEGKVGLLGKIARAYGDELNGDKFVSQINELVEKKYIPEKIKNSLHFVRTQYNLVKHSEESLSPLTVDDAARIGEEVRAIIKWYYCKCDKGPKLPSIYLPTVLVTAQVGHQRTILGLVEIDDDGNVEIKKNKIIASDDFFRGRGFDFFRVVLSIFTNGANPEGYAFSLACPVDRDGNRLKSYTWREWPTDITSIFNRKLKSLVVNDAFALGFAVDIKDKNETTLVLTLGSFIGCAFVKNETGFHLIKPKEIGHLKFDVDNASGGANELIGEEYFKGIHADDTYDYSKIVSIFTRRLIDIIHDLKKTNLFSSVIIGGGRSVFISHEIIKKDLASMNISAQILSDEEHIIKALGKAWVYKYRDNFDYYDAL